MLRSLKPFTPESVARDVVRGQYRAGTVDGEPVPGYLEEAEGAARTATPKPSSRCAPRSQNWRWAGVPFYLRTGKRLAARDAQIVVNFRPAPHAIFPGPNRRQPAGDQAAARRRPGAAPAGAKGGNRRQQRRALAPVSLDLDFDKAFAERARRRLRAPAARRDRRPPEPVRAQRRAGAGLALGRAVLDAWRTTAPARARTPPAPGGPAAASALIARDGFAWAEEE